MLLPYYFDPQTDRADYLTLNGDTLPWLPWVFNEGFHRI